MHTDEIKNVPPLLQQHNVSGSPYLSEQRVIKFKCIVMGNNKEKIAEFHEWLDGDGWKHDYYAPIVTNGVFSHEELGDGWFGEIIRRQFIGVNGYTGNYYGRHNNQVELHEGDIVEACSEGSRSTFVIKYRNEGNPCWLLYPNWQSKKHWSIAASNIGTTSNLFYDDLKLLGNVDENPELLRTVQQ